MTSVEFRALHAREHQAAVSKSPAGRFKPPSVPQERRTSPPPTTDTKAPAAAAVVQSVTFPGRVPGNNGADGLIRMHWRKRLAVQVAYQKHVLAAGLRRCPGPVRLELVRYSIGRQMDYDNLVSTGKATIDALVRCGILPDDNPTVIAERSYTQERAADKATQRTVIRLIPL